MERIADDIAATSSREQAALLLAKRPMFGKTRVCVVRRLGRQRAAAAIDSNHAGGGSTKESEQGEGEAGIVVVVALVQSGTVRRGQALEALLPGSRLLAHHAASCKASCAITRPSMMASYRVVSIERFGKPVYVHLEQFHDVVVMRATHSRAHATQGSLGLTA
jgi:hypothetical protein